MIITKIYFDGEWICETTTITLKNSKKDRDYIMRYLKGKNKKRKTKKKK